MNETVKNDEKIPIILDGKFFLKLSKRKVIQRLQNVIIAIQK